MDKNTQSKSQLLIDGIDSDLREKIIRLDQKLKGLKAEIDAKLESSHLMKSDTNDGEKLSRISQEVEDAIAGIATLVSLVSSEDEETTKAFLNSKEMQIFSEMISENLEKITEITMNF